MRQFSKAEVIPSSPDLSTYISLAIALVIPAFQAMGFTVGPLIAIPLWVCLLIVLMHMTWTRPRAHLIVKVIVSIFAASVISVLIYRSFVGPIVPVAKAEVYFFDKVHMPAKEITFADISQYPKAFSDILRDNPSQMIPVKPQETSHMLSVIVRNPTTIPVRNASISIISNIPIKGETNGARPFSETQTAYDVRLIRPYKDSGAENFFSISFVPTFDKPMILTVTIESDNSKPYTGVQVFNFYKSDL